MKKIKAIMIILSLILTTFGVSGCVLGSSNGSLSNFLPSGTNVVSKKIVGSPPHLNTATIDGSASDGHLFATASTYMGARGATTGVTYYTYDDYSVGQYVMYAYPGDHYFQIYRACVYFDTSGIPSNADITSATLSVYCDWKQSDENNFDVVIGKGQINDFPHDPMVGYDYGQNYYVNGGSKNYNDFVTNSDNSITLSADGLGYIKKGSETKLVLLSSNDINMVPIIPPTDYGIKRDQIHLLSYEAGHAAVLTVQYTVPPPNNPPNTPSKPSGPDTGYVGQDMTYTTSTTDPDGDQ